MTTFNTMREAMLAAGLVAVSACGVVMPGDSASAGSGEGSDMEEVIGCETASDCASGQACDTGAKECVADVLTLDGSEFVDDGLRWWAATSGPVLRGKYEGGGDAVVHVKVGAAAPVLAAVDGTRWSVQMPTGTFMASDSLVSVTMTDPARGVVELEQMIALDTGAPVIGVGPSKVRDERGDVISFGANGPVHDHQGAEIDLAGTGCVSVYKYSYLMDTQAPAYGSEAAANPLTWAVTVQDARVAGVEYRVRDGAGTVVRDWMPVVGSGTAYPVTLYRDGDAGLGDAAMKAGEYSIDVRATDWAGLASTASYCMNFQPLAAPLEFAQMVTPTDADALTSMKLQLDGPVSRVATPGVGAAIAEQQIVQHSSEPVFVAAANPALSGTWRAQWSTGWIPSTSTRTAYSCGTGGCGVIPRTWASGNGTLASGTTKVQLLDANGNALPSVGGGFLVPGRAVGAPATTYRLRVMASNVTELGSTTSFPFAERIVGSLAYTGSASGGSQTGCVATDRNFPNTCIAQGTYIMTKALKSVGMTLNATALDVKVAPMQGGAFVVPAHTPSSMFVAPAIDWDGGVEDTF